MKRTLLRSLALVIRAHAYRLQHSQRGSAVDRDRISSQSFRSRVA